MRERRRTPLSVALSVLVHIAVAVLVVLLWHPVQQILPKPTIAQKLPPVPTITIQRLASASARRTTPKPARPRPAPPRVAQAPRVRPVPVHTLPPPPKAASKPVPRPQPTPPPQAPIAAAPRRALHAQTANRSTAKNALSPQQLAALDSQFSQAIKDDQRAVTQTPQTGAPVQTMSHSHVSSVLSGVPAMAEGGGDCTVDQTWYVGQTAWHYLTCRVHWSDGSPSEIVSIPWPVHYPRNRDAPTIPDMPFDLTDPPANWRLPHPFPLSHLVCNYFRQQCASVLAREGDAGDPNYGAP